MKLEDTPEYLFVVVQCLLEIYFMEKGIEQSYFNILYYLLTN